MRFLSFFADLMSIGVVELNDLRIKRELLDALVLPISIKMGTE